jgi:tRNA 2-thiocytidine biosynthesis protein TtcA
MIEDGDRILVGISGGKDSLTLLWSLVDKRARSPVRFDLFPVYVDPGFGGDISDPLDRFCRALGLSLRTEMTDYGLRGHSEENRENPCFLCSRLRRKRLFEIADELDCRKIALGHHKDDIIETLFLNICYAGEISSMAPVQPLFKGLFSIIRPLAFAEEDLIRRFSREKGFPEATNPCPSSDRTKRSEIKDLLNRLYRGNRKVKGNIFRALSRLKPDYLL